MSKELFKRILSSIIMVPIILFVILQGSYLFIIFILICFILSSYEWHRMSKNKFYKFIGFILLIISFYSFYKIRIEYALDYILLVLLICISTDIGGYTFGKILGGPNLTKISPNKTYAGTTGGYFLSILSSYIYLELLNMNSIFVFNKSILLIIIVISTISQLGDIIISYFKRVSKIKDTGKIIPGHGGILDKIDGMIFVFPIVYLLFQLDLFSI